MADPLRNWSDMMLGVGQKALENLGEQVCGLRSRTEDSSPAFPSLYVLRLISLSVLMVEARYLHWTPDLRTNVLQAS